jgi:ketosteroid isomerase-like protein
MAQLTKVVQEVYANFSKGNIAGIEAVLAEDIRFIHAGAPDVPYGKARSGKVQAMTFFKDLADAVEVAQFEPKNYVEQGDTVVVFGHWGGRAKKTGKSFQTDWAMIWTFSGGKVQFYQAFEDTNAVAKAFR